MHKTHPTPKYINEYFDNLSPGKNQIFAMREYFIDVKSAEEVAAHFGYSVAYVYIIAQSLKKAFSKQKLMDLIHTYMTVVQGDSEQ
ncbi:MAG: hypothetical protein LBF68_08200 [Christensenellaceae bacterium]|jgi:hypothetical protein|nr:hypothetical protein [Christensenellaceae bacterium]